MNNINEWTFQNLICDNGISKIYKAVKNDGTNAVIKHLRLPIDSNRAMELVNRGKISTVNDSINYLVNVMNQEINILSALNNNPYILKMYDAIQNNNGNQSDFYIIMENAVDINQYFANNGFSENDVVKLGIDICSALEACNGINVIHNDIKPSNIFYDGNNFKLGDFGSSTYGGDNNLVYFGTPNYLSPEVCFKYPTSEYSDIYSLGLVMYSLLAGHLPFVENGVTEDMAFTKRMNGENIPYVNGVSNELMNVVLKACSYRPENRFTSVSEMKNLLISIGTVNNQRTGMIVSNSKLDDTISVFDNQLIADQMKMNYEIYLKKDRAKKRRIFNNLLRNGILVALFLVFIISGSLVYLFNRECDLGFINKNGRCVAGYYYCADGFVLNKNNQCQKTIESVEAKLSYSCQSGYTLKDDVCVNTQTLVPTSIYKCADGFKLNGTKCEMTESIDAIVTYTCPSGYVSAGDKCVTVSNKDASSYYTCKDSTYSLSGSKCTKKVTKTVKATISYYCNSGGTLNGTTCNYTTAASGYYYYKTCSKGTYSYTTGKCHYSESALTKYTCESGATNDGAGNCISTYNDVQDAVKKYSCPSGYTPVGAQCAKTTGISGKKKYTCPDSAKLVNNKCVSVVKVDAVNMYVCPDGYVVSGSGCIMKEFPKAVKKYSCSRVYTLNGDRCEKYETVPAKPVYTGDK